MSQSRYALVVAVVAVLMLAVTSGALDATGFSAAQVFTGNQTGNLVIIAMTLTGGGYPDALAFSALALAAFIAGMVISLALVVALGSRFGIRRTLLLAETCVILATALVMVPPADSAVFIALLGLAQGIQGVAITSVLGVAVRTVVVTGSILDVGKHLHDRHIGKGVISLASPIGYALGALAGAMMYRSHQPVALVFAAITAGLSALLLRGLTPVTGVFG